MPQKLRPGLARSGSQVLGGARARARARDLVLRAIPMRDRNYYPLKLAKPNSFSKAKMTNFVEFERNFLDFSCLRGDAFKDPEKTNTREISILLEGMFNHTTISSFFSVLRFVLAVLLFLFDVG